MGYIPSAALFDGHTDALYTGEYFTYYVNQASIDVLDHASRWHPRGYCNASRSLLRYTYITFVLVPQISR